MHTDAIIIEDEYYRQPDRRVLPAPTVNAVIVVGDCNDDSIPSTSKKGKTPRKRGNQTTRQGKKKRSKENEDENKSLRYTPAESELLLHLLMDKKDTIESPKSNGPAIREKNAAWVEVTSDYNKKAAEQRLPIRSEESLRGHWKNLKFKVRTHDSDRKGDRLETGAGSCDESDEESNGIFKLVRAMKPSIDFTLENKFDSTGQYEVHRNIKMDEQEDSDEELVNLDSESEEFKSKISGHSSLKTEATVPAYVQKIELKHPPAESVDDYQPILASDSEDVYLVEAVQSDQKNYQFVNKIESQEAYLAETVAQYQQMPGASGSTFESKALTKKWTITSPGKNMDHESHFSKTDPAMMDEPSSNSNAKKRPCPTVINTRVKKMSEDLPFENLEDVDTFLDNNPPAPPKLKTSRIKKTTTTGILANRLRKFQAAGGFVGRPRLKSTNTSNPSDVQEDEKSKILAENRAQQEEIHQEKMKILRKEGELMDVKIGVMKLERDVKILERKKMQIEIENLTGVNGNLNPIP